MFHVRRQDLQLAQNELGEIEGILRLLQLLCEGHHLQLQNYLREQAGCSNPVNVVNEVMMFLKELVSIGPMEETIMKIAVQCFNTLTEFCQGPCPDNQMALVACNVTSDVNVVLQCDLADRCAPQDSPLGYG